MSCSYLFHLPRTLPLAIEELSAEVTGPFPDRDLLKRQLSEHFPGLEWRDEHWASATTDAGWIEPRLFEHDGGLYLSLRCSLRSDYDAVVQSLCDRYGWIAFDQEPRLFQPHAAPLPIC